ncbi:10511_t:CDS:2, partial [Diversispora eburnea]
LAKLSELFDHNYEIVEQMVEPMDEDTNGDVEMGDANVNRDEFLKVSSVAKVTHKNDFQTFHMKVELWASVDHDDQFSLSPLKNTLEFIVNLPSCGIGQMLNEKCLKLQNFIGYYFDSVEIVVSPIPHIPGDTSEMIIFENECMSKKHNSFDRSVGKEKTFGLGVNIGKNLGATASYNAKNSKSITSTSDYWHMEYTHCPIEGVRWSYCFAAQDIDKTFKNQRNFPSLRDNFGDWYFENSVKGFSVTIKQVLNCINKPAINFLPFNFFNKLSVMKCPKMVHTLEITFNDLEKFNEGFAELRKLIHRGTRMPKLELGSKNLDPDFLENEYVNSSIKRELRPETNK